MEIIFVRHGHGEHLLDYPSRLQTLHPGLTEYGRSQVLTLRDQLHITDGDLIIVSPTKRTIQTAELLLPKYTFYISPLVGPRMFPLNPEFPFLDCDVIYSRKEVAEQVGELAMLDFDLTDWGEGINRMRQEHFDPAAKQLLAWCAQQNKRTIIISHDGTITHYRILLGETGLTRKDFLGEAGIHSVKF